MKTFSEWLMENIDNKSKNLALTAAIRRNNHSMIEVLLKHGADPNHITNSTGMLTPFHLFVRDGAGHKTLPILRLFIKHGADINKPTGYNNTPLHLAAREEQPEIVKELLAHGANPFARNNAGDTPAQVAMYNEKDIADIINKHIKDNNLTESIQNDITRHGDSPLHLAIERGNLPMVKALIKNGADVNQKETYFGYTPIHAASFHGHPEIVEHLLDNGADIHMKSKSGISMIDRAATAIRQRFGSSIRAHYHHPVYDRILKMANK